MSKRRKIGDRVWLKPMTGFGASHGEWATIPDTEGNRQEPAPCIWCNDPECREWVDCWTEAGANACHVSECEMFDAEQGGST